MTLQEEILAVMKEDKEYHAYTLGMAVERMRPKRLLGRTVTVGALLKACSALEARGLIHQVRCSAGQPAYKKA